MNDDKINDHDVEHLLTTYIKELNVEIRRNVTNRINGNSNVYSFYDEWMYERR
jgi:hypothetical protein